MEPVILLIEDSENDVLLLRHAFTKAGLARPLQIVRDGVDAMSYLLGVGPFADRQKHPLPSLLLLDLNLPRLNGLELLAWLRSQPDFQHLMIVVLTGSAHKEQIETAYRMGACSYLVKPTQSRNLQHMIDAFYQYWMVHNQLPEATSGLDLQPPSARPLAPLHHKAAG